MFAILPQVFVCTNYKNNGSLIDIQAILVPQTVKDTQSRASFSNMKEALEATEPSCVNISWVCSQAMRCSGNCHYSKVH